MRTIDVIREQGQDDEIIIDDHLTLEEVDKLVMQLKAELETIGMRVNDIILIHGQLKERRAAFNTQARKSEQTIPRRSRPDMDEALPGGVAKSLPRLPRVRITPSGQVHMKDNSKW